MKRNHLEAQRAAHAAASAKQKRQNVRVALGEKPGVGMAAAAVFLAIAVTALVACFPFAAHAANSAFDGGSSAGKTSYPDANTGNAFLVDKPISNMNVGCDLYWAGSTLDASGLTTGAQGSGSALIAGNTLTLRDSVINGSLRMAGQNVHVESTNVMNNITVAGQDVSISSDVTAKGVYAAGSTVYVSGSYAGGFVSGGMVTFGGTVNGDLVVSAGQIEIKPGAVVTGTLTVPANANVVVGDGAQVSLEYSEAAAAATQSNVLMGTIMPMIAACVMHVLLALLFLFLFKKTLAEATVALRQKPGRTLGLGAAVFFVAPILALLLIVPLITAPISVLMIIVMVTVWLFAIPFAGVALGCRLFASMRPSLAASLGTIILTVLCYLPFLFFLVPTVCTIFIAGFFCQKFLDVRRERKASPVTM